MQPFDLENHPRINTGFKTPDGYFDALDERLLSQIPNREIPVVSLFARYRNAIYAAAAILVLALSVPIFNLLSKPSETIDEAALEQYLAYEAGINQFDLILEMEAEDIDLLEQQSELPVADEAIEDALFSGNTTEQLFIE